MKNIKLRGGENNTCGAVQTNASSLEGSRISSDIVNCCCISAAPLNRAREKCFATTRGDNSQGMRV